MHVTYACVGHCFMRTYGTVHGRRKRDNIPYKYAGKSTIHVHGAIQHACAAQCMCGTISYARVCVRDNIACARVYVRDNIARARVYVRANATCAYVGQLRLRVSFAHRTGGALPWTCQRVLPAPFRRTKSLQSSTAPNARKSGRGGVHGQFVCVDGLTVRPPKRRCVRERNGYWLSRRTVAGDRSLDSTKEERETRRLCSEGGTHLDTNRPSKIK